MRNIVAVIIALAILAAGGVAGAEDPLERHVRVLSSDIGKRNALNYDNLEHAADYIKKEFASYGYEPADDFYFMRKRQFSRLVYRNVVATKEGSSAANKIIIVCAHYDTFRDAPGADDNASGVASVLELARLLGADDLAKTVRFVAFTNEELELLFEDRDMGSYGYARRAREAGEDIEAVICLDMTGYYSNEPGSQGMPVVMRFFYTDTGNFIGIGGDIVSYDIIESVVEEFRESQSIPHRFLIIPEIFLPEIMTTDNRSFWTFG